MALIHDRVLLDDPELLDGALDVLVAAMHHERLTLQLGEAMNELQDSLRRIAEAADLERVRIERDLHDGSQQRLIALRIRLGLAEELLKTDPALGVQMIGELGYEADAALDELRAVAHGITRQPIEIESAAYFSCVEAMQNALKHARGATGVWITVTQSRTRLCCEIRDDGVGFPAGDVGGRGLRNMHDRIEAVGGTVVIDSGRGARVSCSAARLIAATRSRARRAATSSERVTRFHTRSHSSNAGAQNPVPQEVEVVVVGAGIAGLVATTVLHEQGVSAVCLEARERVGGRAASVSGWMDLGATWFWDGQAAIAETVAALGLATYPQVLDGDALIEQADGGVRLAGNPIDRPGRRVREGMQAVPLELARRLPEGMVRTSAAVASVAFEESVIVTTSAETYAASLVLVAVPPKLAVESIAFRPALAPALIEAAQAVHTWMSDTVKVLARYEEPFWRSAGLAGAALSHVGPFCEFHDHSGPEPGQAALFGFAPAARLGGASSDAIGTEFKAQVERLWGPRAPEPLELHVADWSADPFTSTSPAQPSTAWYYGTPVLRLPQAEGRLIFGSTETGPAFPGYLEGAVLAGRRAAGQALDRVR